MVDAGLVEPQADQLREPVGLLRGQVVELRAVLVGVVELPGVLVEVAPAADRGVGGDGLPAVVPDPAGAEHRVELGRPRAGQVRGVEAVAHADALDRELGDALDGLRLVRRRGSPGRSARCRWRGGTGARISPRAVMPAGQEMMHGSRCRR